MPSFKTHMQGDRTQSYCSATCDVIARKVWRRIAPTTCWNVGPMGTARNAASTPAACNAACAAAPATAPACHACRGDRPRGAPAADTGSELLGVIFHPAHLFEVVDCGGEHGQAPQRRDGGREVALGVIQLADVPGLPRSEVVIRLVPSDMDAVMSVGAGGTAQDWGGGGSAPQGRGLGGWRQGRRHGAGGGRRQCRAERRRSGL
jgi:hypothetical protein